jgi:GNAT superfamily N-acetyltransferase
LPAPRAGLIIEPAQREEFLALMQETYGESMSPAEFDWWFDRNPAGPRILNSARDEQGTALGALAMSFARMSQGLAAFAVHAVTTPAARGRGVFSTLELHNEEEAAGAGAGWALGFTNPMAGPILVGKLGWEDVTSLRIWVRPRRLRLRRSGSLRAPSEVEPRPHPLRGHHILRDPSYLTWRYADSPRTYAQVGDVVVTHALWHGLSSAVVCEHGRELGAALKLVDADVAVAIVNPGEERRFLGAGFVPTPRTIRFIGKRLTEEAPELPKRRDAWRFTLGDLDFF